jgi:hypothetical protein
MAEQKTSGDSEDVLRGQRAAAILDADVFKDALQIAEEAIIMEWRGATQPARREAIHAKLMALDEIVTQLRAIMDTGTILTAKAARRAL